MALDSKYCKFSAPLNVPNHNLDLGFTVVTSSDDRTNIIIFVPIAVSRFNREFWLQLCFWCLVLNWYTSLIGGMRKGAFVLSSFFKGGRLFSDE